MRLRLGVLAVLAVLAFAPNVLADSYTFTDSGCFSNPGTCSSNGNSSVNFVGLTNTTLSFTSISSPTTTSSGTPFSLGSFTLSNPGLSFYLGSFALDIDFTSPAGTNGSPLVAAVFGNILIDGATIVFSPSPQVFTYPGGTFTLSLLTDPISISGGNSTTQLKAQIAAVSMPEGSSLAMLGISGLVLVGALFKNRFFGPARYGRAGGKTNEKPFPGGMAFLLLRETPF
jgi:hypothetical protein